MNRKSSVTYNYIMSALLMFSQALFSLVSLPYISRVLQPAGVGKVTFAMSIISNCVMTSQLGIPTYGIRECAKYRDDRDTLSQIVQELTLLNFFMCLATYAFLGIGIQISEHLYSIKDLIWILSINMITTMLSTEWLYRALEEYSYIAVVSLIFNSIAVALLPICVRSSNDTSRYACLAVLAGIGISICNIIRIRKIININRKRKYHIKRHLKPVLIFYLTSMAITIYTNLDIIMLGFMQNDIAVGYYNTAIKVKTILVKTVATLGTVLLPRASYYLKNNYQNEFIEMGRRALHIVVMISTPLATYFAIFARDCVELLSGEGYLPSVIPMRILMPTVLFISLTNILGMQILIPLGREKQLFVSVLLGAVTDIIINMRLIPTYGVSGAAIGTLIAEIVVLIVQIIYLRKIIIKLVTGIEWGKIVVATIGSGIVVYGLTMTHIYILIKIIVSLLIFVGGYCLGLLLLKESLFMEIKRTLSKNI